MLLAIFAQAALHWFLTLEQQGATTLNENLLYYVSEAGKISNPQTFEAMIQQTLPETGVKMMNVFEHMRTEGFQKGQMAGIEKGIEKGRTAGREEGIKEGALEIAQRMLATGAEADFVAHITALPLTIVCELQTKIKASAV